MKIIGIDGKEYNWNVYLHKNKTKGFSALHVLARGLIKELFPYDLIYEDITLPGTKTVRSNKPLIADFFLPKPRLVIEVHGQQHYQYNPFFFEDKKMFLIAQTRDRNKKEWCKQNQINYIELPYKESKDDWRKRIESR